MHPALSFLFYLALSLSLLPPYSLSVVTFRQSLSGGAIVLGPCHNPWPFYKYYVERLIIHWNLHRRKNTSKNTAKKSTTGTTRRPTKHVVALLCSNLNFTCLAFSFDYSNVRRPPSTPRSPHLYDSLSLSLFPSLRSLNSTAWRASVWNLHHLRAISKSAMNYLCAHWRHTHTHSHSNIITHVHIQL